MRGQGGQRVASTDILDAKDLGSLALDLVGATLCFVLCSRAKEHQLLEESLTMEMDLTAREWTLVGWDPNAWAWAANEGTDLEDTGLLRNQSTPVIPAHLPGSVQDDLLRADIIPDWNVGLNARQCEWVEHRHWEYSCRVEVPAAWEGQRILLHAEGLDYAGHVLVDGKIVGAFRGMLMPHEFDLTEALVPGRTQRLSLIFEEAPHEQGQLGYTSRSRLFKARYAYSWDWAPRLVPLGIWDRLSLVTAQPVRLHRCLPYAGYDAAAGTGSLAFRLDVETPMPLALRCRVRLQDGARLVAEQVVPCAFGPGRTETRFDLGLALDVAPWWPNGMGARALYDLTVQLENESGDALDSWQGRVGFRQVRWLPCEGAPANADPWICEVNGRAVFLQGINWTPVRMTYGSVTRAMYAQRLRTYAEMGLNVLRVWGGAILEKPDFYDLCDELGLMVWQEFPLSSSGIDNEPPGDPQALADLAEIAASYIWRRGGHASLLLWCGGNELTWANRWSNPVDATHPAIAALGGVVARLAPDRRFVVTSSSGPSFSFVPSQAGKGLHHDVHGPWTLSDTLDEWKAYWDGHDALFVSEVGVPSASPLALLRETAGEMPLWPPSHTSPFWRFRSPWWIQWEQLALPNNFDAEREELDRYVSVSQALQAEALAYMAASCKQRFPHCGGVIIWMGHDCYVCSANTSIVDFNGEPKPAVAALAKVFRGE
ncbi:MAG: glycoside hydrolase family 2 protein [Anaerolineae bacterium]